jgi:hypothetical protein
MLERMPLLPAPVVACLAALLSALIAVWAIVRVRGSTAVPAAGWAVAACLALALEAGARASGRLLEPSAAAAARLVVVALSLCPAMSLLGAKRPQHGVWQLIVATLAVVLILPAASALLVRPGSFPDVHMLERCFMPLLVAVGWMNFIGTGQWVAATLIAAGQYLLLRGYLPGREMETSFASAWAAKLDAFAALLIVAGCGLAVMRTVFTRQSAAQRRGAGLPRGLAAEIDPPFLALRDTLGAAWALRIAERFDMVAAARGWPCRLRFGGLEEGAGRPDGGWQRDAVRTFRALARRFASADWIARHSGRSRDGTN